MTPDAPSAEPPIVRAQPPNEWTCTCGLSFICLEHPPAPPHILDELSDQER